MIRTHRPFAAALALMLTACGSEGGPAITDADRQMAEEQHPQLLASFGGHYGGTQAAYLSQVGEKIADAAGIAGQCRFTLVNTDVVNAFAVPGCYIYVTRGLMGLVNSEDELASVLAHELGHIVADHSGEQQRQSVLSTIGVLAVEAITGSDRLGRIAGAAAGLYSLRYSRSHEYEADDLGLAYLIQAGYDPYAAVDMLEVLQRYHRFQDAARGSEADAKGIPEWALTHPLTENRIARSREAAEKTGIKPGSIAEKKTEFLRQVDGLLYGDDPEQGFVFGRRFAHPLMRIAFEAPEGFTLTNSPQAVLIEGPGGVRGEFGGGRMPAGGLEAYARDLLRAMLGNAPAEIVSAQRFLANGVPAAFLQAAVPTDEGAVPISLAAYRGGDGGAYHILILSRPGSQPQPAIGELLRSFRLLSPAQAATLRPRFIRVERVGPDETLRSLAAHTAADRPVELLMMLNDLSPATAVRPGSQVKLVKFAGR